MAPPSPDDPTDPSRVFQHTGVVTSVQFSPHDPDEILTGSLDGTVRLWRKSDGRLIRVFENPVMGFHCIAVAAVQFNPHNPDEILMGTAHPPTAKLCRKSDGDLIRVFEGHTKGVLSVQFSPHDPDEILTGSADGTVKLWRKSDGRLIRTFEGHTGSVQSVQYNPFDPDEIMSGADDGVRLWRVRGTTGCWWPAEYGSWPSWFHRRALALCLSLQRVGNGEQGGDREGGGEGEGGGVPTVIPPPPLVELVLQYQPRSVSL